MRQKNRSSKIERPALQTVNPEARPLFFPPSATRALIVLAVIACGAAVWATQNFLMPTATAVVIALALTPIVRGLERLGLPTAAASVVVILTAAALLSATVVAIAPGLSELIERAPEIAQTIERKTRPLKIWLGTLQTATDKLDEVTQILGGDGAAAAAPPVQSSGGAVMELAPQVIAQTIYALVLALFLISVREPFRKRLILLPTDRDNRLRIARILNESLAQVSHYLFIMTLINCGVALTTTIVFSLLGVPYAAVWGVVFGAASFIPYVGPTATIALCALAQLVTAPTIEAAIAPPILMVCINFIESSFVTPLLISRRIAVSSLAVFLTVAMFAWLSGPFAAIVAVPLLILFSAIARHVPGFEPLAVLLLAEKESSRDIKKSGLEKLFAEEGAATKPTSERAGWWRRWTPVNFDR